ncbi:SWIM zinc finger family protein [Streptomyces lancefieldiae]|uniref:SWIM zinc finger family protein n=1 Tax=Streptomyces lancefieldiae TaxID=3075520 RepID=A0ABU3AL13_9ACTN|nr:SWIM zinc finger family protein [Streptomyces sp. DSM 40712]MDT0610886.1 SWIM zinc finger family protein [Streptomyces sp. DSM 40712]
MNPQLPPVAPSVTAELVAALTPRLRKRLDAGVAKVAGRPTVREGDVVRIAVDDDTGLELHTSDGVVTSAEAIRCGCLLAPDCLHRAAAASAAPVADPTEPASTTPPPPDSTALPATAVPSPHPIRTGTGTRTRSGTAIPDRDGTQSPGSPQPSPTAPAAAPTPISAPALPADTATPEQRAAAVALHEAAAEVLEAGADGAGAVLQAELLRSAHTARLAGLPRAASRAVAVVTALRAARGADPAYRLADLVAALRDVLLLAHRLPAATGPELAELRGTVRQPYTPDGSLRLYGLFAEPVLTATGYAGAITWTADGAGRLYTVADVAPGGASRATGAAERAVRLGDTSLTHRELSRAGLAVSGATVSPTGRLGAGAGVRAVRASGVAWHAEPLDRLWAVPPAEQVSRALTGERDLLFLDVTLIGTAPEAAGECLVADCGGLMLRLAAAHDDPALPHRENLRLLASARGARLRVVARLTPAPLPRALLLAVSHPTDPGVRVDLGLDRLRRADLPVAPKSRAVPGAPAVDEAPVHLLRRRVHQAAAGGRRVLAFPGSRDADGARLRRHGLGTGGELLAELQAAAADRPRDPFGRLLPADTGRFARAWLGAAVYTEELDRALCAAAWGAELVGLAGCTGPANGEERADPPAPSRSAR